MNLADLQKHVNQNFLSEFNTKILGGFSEPFYKAATSNDQAEIQFTRNYTRSALHELSHWLVAGDERRTQDDFGYWYLPDGRNQEEQNRFYQCEIKPQAIERALCEALEIEFEVSADNLDNSVSGTKKFCSDVQIQFEKYKKLGFPKRAAKLIKLLENWNSLLPQQPTH